LKRSVFTLKTTFSDATNDNCKKSKQNGFLNLQTKYTSNKSSGVFYKPAYHNAIILYNKWV